MSFCIVPVSQDSGEQGSAQTPHTHDVTAFQAEAIYRVAFRRTKQLLTLHSWSVSDAIHHTIFCIINSDPELLV
jgi:hypothetical protein